MYKLIFIFFAIAFLVGCNASKNSMTISNNRLTTNEKNNGWQLLFDGNTTNGWHTYGKQAAGKVWKAENGTLHLDAASKNTFTTPEGGDLVTNEEFDNFDLKLQWKISPAGNSGVIFYVKEDPKKYSEPYYTGPEMQVLDNNGHPDAKIYKHKAGDLYDLIASTKEVVKPVGEWNQAEIIANNGKLDFYLNGEHIVGTTMWDDNWRNMVANSKFKAWPDFGAFKKGKIDLQDHGNDVWFRDIKIKRL
jgi:hypothetical protein